jgi:hypothetical protein
MDISPTEGPWIVERLNQTDFAVIGPKGNRKVAKVEKHSNPQNAANANLIAAAPELLDAAQAAEESLHHMLCAGGLSPHEEDVYTDLKEAIAKAKGKL